MKNMFRSTAFLLGFAMVFAFPFLGQAAIIYDASQVPGSTTADQYVIDFDQSSAGTIDLQFGNSTRYFRWNGAGFDLSSSLNLLGNLNLNSNQITSVLIENVAALPGGAVGLGAAGTGRIVQLTAIDSIAPGCGGPSCAAGMYSWNGGIWKSMSGAVTVANSSKIVTVGSVGRDYTTIAAAAAYLNTLSAGEMWIDPEVFPVSTTVDLSNIRVKGADNNLTTIQINVGGKIIVKDTKFEDANIQVNVPYGLDVKYVVGVSTSVEFSKMSFNIGGSNVLLDSSSIIKPTSIISFQNSEQLGAGTIVKAKALSQLNNVTSSFTVIDLLTTNPLKMVDWPVTIVGGSNVVTSGVINSVPDRTILVSPGMNIQGAIDSLGTNGGVVKLLIGTHIVTAPVRIDTVGGDNIAIVGEGAGTVLTAPLVGWTGGTGPTVSVLQVGAANGGAPRSNILVQNFKIQVGPDVHGILVKGGNENKVIDMIVQSIGPKTNTHTGIVFTDGLLTPSARFTATRSIVNNNNIPANRWVDGVHFDGIASIPGLFGHGNGITDSIISEMIVAEAQETAFAFAKVSASGIFSNRARNVGANAALPGTPFGMFFTDLNDVTVINNTLEGNSNANTVAVELFSDVDNSTFIGNVVRGGAVPFNAGIRISSANSNLNIISQNQFEAVNTTQVIIDNGTNTKLETLHRRAATDPTVTNDISNGYQVGTIWINTALSKVFVLINSSTGAAVWLQLNGNNAAITGTTSNSFTVNNDAANGDISTFIFGDGTGNFIFNDATGVFSLTNGTSSVNLQFGSAVNKTFGYDGINNRFNLTDSLLVNGNISVSGNGIFGSSGTPNATLDVNGSFATRRSEITLGNSANNNVVIGNSTYVRITGPNNAFSISGFAGGVDGRLLILENDTTQNMTITRLGAASLVVNRIDTKTAGDIVTSGGGTILLIYDAGRNLWKVVSTQL